MLSVKKNERVHHIDGLRGIAILAVVFYHAYARWGEIEPFTQQHFLSGFFSGGWLGVQLFFAISGFVIYMSLERSANAKVFLKKRWLRLFPAMFMASFFIMATSYFIPERPGGIPSFLDILPGVLFIDPELLNFLFSSEIASLDGAFWSIYVEFKFYVLAAVSYFILGQKNLYPIFLCFALYVLSGVLIKLGLSDDNGVVVFFYDILYWLGAAHYGWFLLGIGCYMSISNGTRVPLLFGVCVALASAVLLGATRSNGLQALLGALFVVVIFLLPLKYSFISKFLSNRFLLYVGFISYPLYLVHQNFVTGSAILIYRFDLDLPAYAYPLLPLAVVILVAHCIAKVEPVLRNFLNRNAFPENTWSARSKM